MSPVNRGYLLTEQSNPVSQHLDQCSALEIVEIFHQEDTKTVRAIAQAKASLAEAIDLTAEPCGRAGVCSILALAQADA